jgi:hypothetical protein
MAWSDGSSRGYFRRMIANLIADNRNNDCGYALCSDCDRKLREEFRKKDHAPYSIGEADNVERDEDDPIQWDTPHDQKIKELKREIRLTDDRREKRELRAEIAALIAADTPSPEPEQFWDWKNDRWVSAAELAECVCGTERNSGGMAELPEKPLKMTA